MCLNNTRENVRKHLGISLKNFHFPTEFFSDCPLTGLLIERNEFRKGERNVKRRI